MPQRVLMNILLIRYSSTFFYPTGFQGKHLAMTLIISYKARVHLKNFQMLLAFSSSPDYRLLVERSTYF